MSQFLIYGFILVFKIIEVSMATLRIVLITKDERLIGAIIGFFEVILWVILVSTVLSNITEEPAKVVIYAAGFAIGNFVGSKLENYLAIGSSNIEAIVLKQHGKQLSKDLRAHGFAVTAVDAKGMNSDREILYIHLPRKEVKRAIAIIKALQNNVVITVTEIKPIYGGFKTLRR